MTITSIQMYVAFQKLFKTDEAPKKDVLQFGVGAADFDAVDQDHNEYLGIDEALKNNAISELLYSNMVSTYGAGAADEAERENPSSRTMSTVDLSKPSGNNPFV